MHLLSLVLLATASVISASQNVFSVHDDLLAFPQYEIIFSEALISDVEANSIVDKALSYSPTTPPASGSTASESKDLDAHKNDFPHPTSAPFLFDPSRETYELMHINGEQQLCIIPIVELPPRNETSEAEARSAEQKELARATTRGWELLKDLEGSCLYFVSGWWSYSFCYNSEITQFHQLPPQAGKPPQRDPKTSAYILGRARPKASKQDEWGSQVAVQKGKKRDPPKTELQVKGDSRYLVQKMEGGTTCDLTGKPRRIEIQFHCNIHAPDRIGYIKEVTTCSYLLVVYTPRLCTDVAFMPPKETKANAVVCRVVVPEEDLEWRYEMRALDHELKSAEPKDTRARVGGLIVGGGKWTSAEGAKIPIPKNFGKENQGSVKTIIVKAKSKADGGTIETLSEADILKNDLDPKDVEQMKEEVKKAAKDKAWQIEVAEIPGQGFALFGIVDDEKDGEDGETEEVSKGEDSEKGSEETFKDEL